MYLFLVISLVKTFEKKFNYFFGLLFLLSDFDDEIMQICREGY
jgi:hypothetical protein